MKSDDFTITPKMATAMAAFVTHMATDYKTDTAQDRARRQVRKLLGALSRHERMRMSQLGVGLSNWAR